MAQRVVLITGANSGVGYSIAQHLLCAPEPFRIILAGRSPGNITAAIDALRSNTTSTTTGPAANPASTLHPLHLDVTHKSTIDAAAAAVRSQFGKLHVLVNNAGIAPTGPDTRGVYRSTLETNVIGPALVSEAFRPLLLAATAGDDASSWPAYSVYVGSVVGSLSGIADPASGLRTTGAGHAAYRASKAALNMLVAHEQVEVEQDAEGEGLPGRLRVRVMCPGFVVSNLRGESEEQRTGGGRAGDPADSARVLYGIIRGEREGDDERGLIRGEDVYRW
ncbi:hypothetical protein N3K66_004070 [Trichothecium roseum]|uniref:Uncharacterized protein n=1 Tax=Trichothecium roseum TaxID=47278 RepID=A0ACC0V7J7_9HYPO|nr:hypothetical protein N3K66_004070 [Trichothecium roseum]